ncbi:MAG: hypothetical protein C4315_06170 [Chloroflexota bacterium]
MSGRGWTTGGAAGAVVSVLVRIFYPLPPDPKLPAGPNFSLSLDLSEFGEFKGVILGVCPLPPARPVEIGSLTNL